MAMTARRTKHWFLSITDRFSSQYLFTKVNAACILTKVCRIHDKAYFLQKQPKQSYSSEISLGWTCGDGTCIQCCNLIFCQKHYQRLIWSPLHKISSLRKLKLTQKLMGNYDKRPAQVQVNGERKHSIKKRKEDVKGCAVGTCDALRWGVKMDQNRWELREPWWLPVPMCSQVPERLSSLVCGDS